MKRLIPATVKSLALSITALAFLTVGQSVARADELTLIGGTTGVLNIPPNPLNYNSARIDGTTTNGTFVLNAPPASPRNLNNLGSFTLTSRPTVSFGGTFDLNVQFDAPPGIQGGNTRFFPATVSFSQTQGTLLVLITNRTQLFAFSNDSGSGVFSLTVNSIRFNLGSTLRPELQAGLDPTPLGLDIDDIDCPSFPCTGALTGTIELVPTPVPEPATLLLLATGVSGLAASVRRRRAGGNKS